MARRRAGLVAAALLLGIVVARRSAHVAPTAGAHRSAPATTAAKHDGGAPRARPALPAMTALRHESIARLGFGDGPGQVGRRRDPESAGEGPMALSLARNGTLYVLDQVHGRVLRRRRDGSFAAPITIGAETPQDLRADGDRLAVLDRLGERSLRRFDGDGRLVDDRSLASIGVVEPGGVTGLFDAGGELYVEESLAGESRRVVRPAAGGSVLPGRPSRDGTQLLTASLVRSEVGAFVVRGVDRSGAPHFTTALTVGRTILGIILLDSDEVGGIYVGVLHAARGSNGTDLVDERMDLFRLDAGGVEAAHLSVPHPPSALECFRELEVAGVGMVWWMHPLDDGSGIEIEELAL